MFAAGLKKPLSSVAVLLRISSMLLFGISKVKTPPCFEWPLASYPRFCFAATALNMYRVCTTHACVDADSRKRIGSRKPISISAGVVALPLHVRVFGGRPGLLVGCDGITPSLCVVLVALGVRSRQTFGPRAAFSSVICCLSAPLSAEGLGVGGGQTPLSVASDPCSASLAILAFQP